MMKQGFTGVAAVAALLCMHAANALDVEIESYNCDSSYPVTADIFMECEDGSSRCTFGEPITLYGDRTYILLVFRIARNRIVLMEILIVLLCFVFCDIPVVLFRQFTTAV